MNTSERMVVVTKGLALRAAFMNLSARDASNSKVPAAREWMEWSYSVSPEMLHYVVATHERLFDEVNIRF